MRQSGLGVASLVLGIIGLLFSLLFIGIVPCIISLVLAIIVMFNKKVSHSLAIAGGICSLLGIIGFSWLYLPGLLPQKQTAFSLDQTYTINDFIEITPIDNRLSIVVAPSNYNGSSVWITDEDDERPYQFIASIKNNGTDQIDLEKHINAELKINSENTYEPIVSLESSDGTKFETSLYIEPNEERVIHIFAFVPEDVYKNGTDCKMKISFSENYDDEANANIGNVYVANFDKDKLYNDEFEEKLEFYDRYSEIMTEDISELAKNISSNPQNIDQYIDDTISLIREINQMTDNLQCC